MTAKKRKTAIVLSPNGDEDDGNSYDDDININRDGEGKTCECIGFEPFVCYETTARVPIVWQHKIQSLRFDRESNIQHS